jgi:hypothetical protein
MVIRRWETFISRIGAFEGKTAPVCLDVHGAVVVEAARPIGDRIRLGLLALLLLVPSLSFGAPAEEPQAPPRYAATYLLDAYPDAYAAYSLRKLSSTYDGPAIRVKRLSDGVEQDFGFVGDDLDVAGLEAWLAGSDGEVVVWYAQVAGTPNLIPDEGQNGPLIAEAGTVLLDEKALPHLKFDVSRETGMRSESAFDPLLPNMATIMLVLEGGEHTITTEEAGVLGLADKAGYDYTSFALRQRTEDYTLRTPGAHLFPPIGLERHAQTYTVQTTGVSAYRNNALVLSDDNVIDSAPRGYLYLGMQSKNGGPSQWDGYLSEVLITPQQTTDAAVQDLYDLVNVYWQLGPLDYNPDAILPQKYDYQVALYNWLKTIAVADVTLPQAAFTWDGTLADTDELADLWVQVEGMTTSRVTRAEPDWYVLDAGNGKGIEATGVVRVWHEPGSEYSGNPPRSWANEPAFIYQLSIPKADGSEGNPYYHLPAMGLRALVVAMVDLMMYHEEMDAGGFGTWQDMYGKAFLSWAEAYRWCKDLLPSDVQASFEEGMGYFLDQMIAEGPRAVNTNMDTFSLQGAANLYVAAADPAIQSKCVQAVKRALFGYTDGELGVRHDVFKTGEFDGGVFDPSGFIMEGDQPDLFYGGESIYHLAGALAVVTDRDTGAIPSDWAFLEEVVRRLEEWRLYQYFYEPGVATVSKGGIRSAYYYHGGAGISGRTGAGVPEGQAGEFWKFVTIADRFEDLRHLVYQTEHISRLPEITTMESDVSVQLAERSTEIQTIYEGTPPEWNGWSPWVKATPYLPVKGWYSRLKALVDAGDESTYPLVARKGTYYNKALGGYPVGDEYWAYKNTDGAREWGFFMEAQARQGGYNGWYGGKVETFWTETTGVILINRHGKAGCDGGEEDSTCWDNLDYRAAQHVWGRDENGKGFTTLLLRGQTLDRPVTFDLASPTPSVTVTNIFNNPAHASNPTQSETGEETGYELEGEVSITNKVEALSNGIRVTHTITSDGTDEVTELWASIPVFLRLYAPDNAGDQVQEDLDDTTIEYWDGAAWQPMPEDQNGDGVPEIVTTSKMRLGRDFLLGDGPQYVYVGFEAPQRTRLSTQIYTDPYQTKTRVRTVHLDLHGNPGTVIPMPVSLSISYTLTTTEPAGDTSGSTHTLDLAQGWNTVSLTVTPDNPDIETMFSGVVGDLVLVQNNTGQIYYPEFGINDIGQWNLLEAYEINTTAATSIVVTGTPIVPEATPITLAAGWNLIPYLPTYALPIEDALASIAADVVVVIDNVGRIYYPEFGINDIVTMEPGQGYSIYVNREVTLTYPAQ